MRSPGSSPTPMTSRRSRRAGRRPRSGSGTPSSEHCSTGPAGPACPGGALVGRCAQGAGGGLGVPAAAGGGGGILGVLARDELLLPVDDPVERGGGGGTDRLEELQRPAGRPDLPDSSEEQRDLGGRVRRAERADRPGDGGAAEPARPGHRPVPGGDLPADGVLTDRDRHVLAGAVLPGRAGERLVGAARAGGLAATVAGGPGRGAVRSAG